MITSKVCKLCKVDKLFSEFSSNPRGLHGYYSRCKQCVKKTATKWHYANREKSLQQKREYRLKNADKMNANSKAWREANKERCAKVSKAWYEANKQKKMEATFRRKFVKEQAIPPWFCKEDVVEFYKAAEWLTKTTGLKANVDHIVPLQSKLVCGLHWAGNLTIITEKMNKSKSNRWWPDMPEPPKIVSMWMTKEAKQKWMNSNNSNKKSVTTSGWTDS